MFYSLISIFPSLFILCPHPETIPLPFLLSYKINGKIGIFALIIIELYECLPKLCTVHVCMQAQKNQKCFLFTGNLESQKKNNEIIRKSHFLVNSYGILIASTYHMFTVCQILY